MPSTPFRGVRISWLTVARKRDLASLPASARALASASAASARRRSVTSRPTAWISVSPRALRTGVWIHDTQRRPAPASIAWS